MTNTKKSLHLADKREPHLVTADEQDMRLDRWFRKQFPLLSQGQIQKHLRKGQIRVDGKRADSSDRLQEGQLLRIPPSFYETDLSGDRNEKSIGLEKQSRINQSMALKLKRLILYEDDDVVVINKPAGLAVQGGTGLKENLDDSLMALSKDGVTKPKLVHRLDRDTSGVLLIARSDFAARKLAESFRHRATQKIYWAITSGVPHPEAGKISNALIRSGEVMQVVPPKTEGAKTATTLYRVVEKAIKQAAFVALWPLTGRTHQLRVHLSDLGTPILGDRLYGGESPENLPMQELGKGLHLHARRLVIPHPRRGIIDVTAPLSGHMKKTWQWFSFDAQADVSFDED